MAASPWPAGARGDSWPRVSTRGALVRSLPPTPEDWNATPICEPLLWVSSSGDTWELVSAQSPFGFDAFTQPQIAQRDGRFVAAGGVGEIGAIWVSDDALTWERTDVTLALAETVSAGDMGWMLTGATDMSDYRSQQMWFSANGHDWDGPYDRPKGLNSGWLPAQLAVGSDSVFGVGGRDLVPVVARLRN